MSLSATDTRTPDLRHPLDKSIDLSFLPKALFDKCKPFIVRYHELNGYSCLADVLWHPETRHFIELNFALRRLFKAATWARSAKRSNEGLVTIAAIILSTEILATGFAGWGGRYPSAQKKARAFLDEHIPGARAWLLERYLFPHVEQSRQALWISAPIYNGLKEDRDGYKFEPVMGKEERIALPSVLGSAFGL
jgi:hypothetical protein